MGLIDTIRSQQAKQHERVERAKIRERATPPSGSDFGVTFSKGTISYKRTKGPVFGVQARVSTAGQINERFTATRLALMGPFALAFKKKKDLRQLYLVVEGDGFGFLVEIDPDKRVKAEQFAMKINTAGRWEPPQPV